MAYASPTTVDNTALTGIFTYLNTVTGGWFGNMLLISLYFIALIGYYKATERFEEAMAVAGFFVLIIAILFWIGSIISGITLGVVLAVAILGVLVLLVT